MSTKNKIISSLQWSATSKGISQLTSWLVTIYVIRLLAPGDYGLMAMVSVVIAFLSTFNEFGLGSALVQSKKLNDEQIGAVYGAMLLLGAALSVLLVLVSPFIANFFNEPRLQILISVAGLQFILNAATIVPESMMRRDMTFKPLSMADLTGVIAGSLSTLTLAVNHYGVWSLVLGNLAGALIRSAILITLNPRRVAPSFRLRGAASFLSYGSYMTGARFLDYFMSQADVLIGAKLLGQEALGLYTVSLQLASLPVNKAMSTVNQIAFSAISSMQDQKHELQLGLLNAIRILAYITFPLIYGMASVAPEFIPAVLGPHWDGAVLPLQIIAVVIPLRMISSLYSTAIFGMGRSDVVFRNTLVGVVVFPLCFYIGAQWGAVGLAAGWLIGMPTVFLINFNQMRRVIGISYLDLIRSIAHPFCSALCMVGALLFIRIFLPKTLDNWIVLACLIFFGATVFSVFAFSIDVRLRKDIQNTVWARYFHHRQ